MADRRAINFFSNERPTHLPPLENAEIRIGSTGDEDVATRMATLRGQDPDEYRARLKAGHHVAYAIGADGELQSWGWFTAPTDRPLEFPWEYGIRIRVMPGSSFLWDFFTMPAYRGRGAYRVVVRHATEQCHLRGASRSWGYAEISNIASRRGMMAAEWEGQVDEVELIRIGPFCRVSRPGFRRFVRAGGVLELDALVQ